MATIKLNGIDTEYNKIYYISTTGSDDTGDGTKENPFATYKKAYSATVGGDLIYFLKGTYNITNIPPTISSYGSSFLYDNGRKLIIYAEKDVYVIINNPTNVSRDIHAISLDNVDSKIIGFIIDYNVTNKSATYSRSIFGSNSGTDLRGYIYNCHFILRSPTSLSYANRNNTMQCINCQFDIKSTLENTYSGKTKFIKCSMNIEGDWNSVWGITTDSDILTNIYYTDKYNIVPYNNEYGVYNAYYKWNNYLFIIKKDNDYVSILNSYYDKENDEYNFITISTLSIDSFNNYGLDGLSLIHDKALLKMVNSKYNLAMIKFQ